VTDLKGVDPHGLVGIALPFTCQVLEEGDGVVPPAAPPSSPTPKTGTALTTWR
jgi:hypothetical protein